MIIKDFIKEPTHSMWDIAISTHEIEFNCAYSYDSGDILPLFLDQQILEVFKKRS